MQNRAWALTHTGFHVHNVKWKIIQNFSLRCERPIQQFVSWCFYRVILLYNVIRVIQAKFQSRFVLNLNWKRSWELKESGEKIYATRKYKKMSFFLSFYFFWVCLCHIYILLRSEVCERILYDNVTTCISNDMAHILVKWVCRLQESK